MGSPPKHDRERPVRVLVADDSDLFGEVVVELIESDPEMQVVGVATNGEQAIRLTEVHRPDVVLMDVRMPIVDGLTAVERIMSRTPTPILVMTADPAGRTGTLAFEALRRGALDLFPKPEAWSGTEAERDELRSRLKLLARVPVVHHVSRTYRQEAPARTAVGKTPATALAAPPVAPVPTARSLVVMGASTGGPPALARILSQLPADFPLPILIVQHLSPGFDQQLVQWLSGVCRLEVAVAVQGRALSPGLVLLAPYDRHLIVENRIAVRLDAGPPVGGHRPAVDATFRSAANVFRSASIGVLLTGMGSDGARALLELRQRGAHTIVQSGESATVDGMPKAARDLGAASEVVALDGIADAILRAARVDARRVGGTP